MATDHIAHPAEIDLGAAGALSLADFATAGQRLRIASGVLGETVVFASDNAPLRGVGGCVAYRAADLAVLWRLRPDELRAVHAALLPIPSEADWAHKAELLRYTGCFRVLAERENVDDWEAATANWDVPIVEADMGLHFVAPRLQTEKPGRPRVPLTAYMKHKYGALYREACERAAADEPGRSAYAAASLLLAGRVTAVLVALRDRLREADPVWEMRLGPLPEGTGRVRSLLARGADGTVIGARVTLLPGAERQMVGLRYPGRRYRNPPFPPVDYDGRSAEIIFTRNRRLEREYPGLRLFGSGGVVRTALLEIAANRCRGLARPVSE